MGIATYVYMVFSSMEQILNDVHDADVFDPVSCPSCIRRWGNNMVSQRLKKHGSDIVYLQKTKPCIRKHL
jgi:cysteine synthase